ncbi:Apyrase [Entamoeba marina]
MPFHQQLIPTHLQHLLLIIHFFTEIVVFENKLYACDNENGLIFEVFNSLHNESNPSLFNYSNLIPRYILPANETGEFNSMKIGLCFAKDSIFHVISNNYVVAALDTEFRIRWGMWENVFTQAGSSLDCDSIEYGKVAYSHMNHTFVFIPFSCCRSGASQSYGCNKIIVTDVEYNIKTTLEFSLPQNKRVEAFKLVPYHEDQLVLLVTEYGNDQTSELMVISLSGIVLLPLTTIDFTKAVSVFEFI